MDWGDGICPQICFLDLERRIVRHLGIPWLRTSAFVASWIGILLIFLQLIG